MNKAEEISLSMTYQHTTEERKIKSRSQLKQIKRLNKSRDEENY